METTKQRHVLVTMETDMHLLDNRGRETERQNIDIYMIQLINLFVQAKAGRLPYTIVA